MNKLQTKANVMAGCKTKSRKNYPCTGNNDSFSRRYADIRVNKST